jgi:beta-lactamase regulating signal transducer with metallopeptidase domain
MRTGLDMAVQGAALILLLLALRPLMKKWLSARLRYALWLLPALRLMLPFTLASGVSAWTWLGREADMGAALPGAATGGILATATGGETAAGATASAFLPPSPGVPIALSDWLPALLLGVWALGALIAFTHLVRANLRFAARTKAARRLVLPEMAASPRNLPVYVVDALASPCLVGFLRPRILVTRAAAESPALLTMTLMHERMHHARRDMLWAALRGLLLCAWWWHPLVWVAARLSREDGEAACDESIVQHMPWAQRQRYGLNLLALLSQGAKAPSLLDAAMPLFSGKRAMKERILMIANWKKKSRVATLCALLSIALLTPLLCTSALGQDAQQTGYTYLALTSYYDPAMADMENVPEEQASRVIWVELFGSGRPQWMVLPEGHDPEQYSFVGIRATFDEPFDVEYIDNGIRFAEIPEGILEPTRVEVIDSLQYGVITELGEDYLVMNLWDRYGVLSDVPTRFSVAPDVLLAYEEPFQAGSGCMAVVDGEGMVLAMVQSNG